MADRDPQTDPAQRILGLERRTVGSRPMPRQAHFCRRPMASPRAPVVPYPKGAVK
jgi:hypothetical protein